MFLIGGASVQAKTAQPFKAVIEEDLSATGYMFDRDEPNIRAALDLVATWPAALRIPERDFEIMVTASDSVWVQDRFADPIAAHEMMRLMKAPGKPRIVIFWDRVVMSVEPVVRMAMAFVEVFHEIKPFPLPESADHWDALRQRQALYFQFLDGLLKPSVYPKLPVETQDTLINFLEQFNRAPLHRDGQPVDLGQFMENNCSQWLN